MAWNTDLGLCNRALRKIGATKISALNDTTDPNAILMNDIYDDCRELVLAEHEWKFCTKRAVLEYIDYNDEDYGERIKWERFSEYFVYQKPSDFVRLIGWSDENAVVREEGQYLISDSDGQNITVNAHINNALIDEWSTSTAYAIGDVVATLPTSYDTWATSTAYETDDIVYNFSSVLGRSSFFKCLRNHNSSSTNEPGDGGNTAQFWLEDANLGYSAYCCTRAHSSGNDAAKSPAKDSAVLANYWKAMERTGSTNFYTTIIGRYLSIIYLATNTTETEFPLYFRDVLVNRLALDAAYTILQSGARMKELEDTYKRSLRRAIFADSGNETQAHPIQNEWVNAKWQGEVSTGTTKVNYRSG